MYDHLGLKVKDLPASVRFYGAALEALGHQLCAENASGASFGPANAPALWLSSGNGPTGPGVHIAFRAADGRDNGRPGLRPDYSATYYAAFLLDPDGNNVEAVCTS